ncbi:MAG: DNA translocase FtsK 4TM domain-containing protein [Actinobacteria bacterium]|nr:DNA translocase FtsK 4TM domain-containing protein [Actinomycetota bacterium]
MATARPKQARRAGAAARTRPRAARPAPRPKRSATRHRYELAAIACVALAVFLAFVIYLGWDGGTLGRWLGDITRWLVGLLVFALPLLLCFVAYMLVARDDRRPRRGVSWGIAMIVAAFVLAAAADAFGVFAGERPERLYRDTYMSVHGGVAGEALWAVLHGVIGRIGVDVLVVALFVAGVLLATGSSLRQWADHSRKGVAAAGRAARSQAEALGARRRDAAATRVVELDESPTIDAFDMMRTSVSPATQYGPAVSTHTPHLVDGRLAAPEIFGGPTSYAPPPEPVAEADEGEQLSLAQAVADEPGGGAAAIAFHEAEKRQWLLPEPSLLQRLGESVGESPDAIRRVSQRLVETLGHFGVTAQVIGTVSGPRVTRYELQLAPGIKVSRVASLKDDLAYALAATEIRVQAPIPGKTAVGVEVPNLEANYVSLGDIHGLFPPHASPMAFWLGKDVTGKAVLADLVKMVHLLIAGTTGSGKSGCLNALISSILLRATPDEVRMIMIDPKKVELSNFNGVPHLLAPVVTNMKQATYVLDNITREMDRRYDVLSRNGCQDIRALNKKLARAGEEHIPYIMVIVDELADLMMVAPSEVEDSIIRLGQLGRSCGIHLVVATQRPSVDVVTGMIKTNIPSRIAFAVASQTDSRIILDQGGAESLLGMGDMLFSPMGSNRLLRVQGALITAHEMKLLTEHWKRQAKPQFQEDLLENPAGPDAEQQAQAAGGDQLLAEAIRTVVTTGAASVALLQRRLRVGYARAGRLVDIMEEMGIISGYDGSKARAVLIDEAELPATLARVAGEDAPEAPPEAAVPAAGKA